MNMKFDLAWYPVTDIEVAKRFYGDVLGLQLGYAMESWAEFSHEPGAAGVAVNLKPSQSTSGATVVLRVTDLDEARTRLAGKGVAFEGDVLEVPGVVRIASLRDPFGNLLQLAQSLLPLQS